MTGSEEGSAVEYLGQVLRYVQGGGKLSSIDATVSEVLRLHARELNAEAPGSVKAMILRNSVEEMRLRHNSLNADAVFRDLEEQARLAGSSEN